MRKQQEITPRHKGLNLLMEELANIDLQSTELKITDLIHRQRCIYRQARGIPTHIDKPSKKINSSSQAHNEQENHIPKTALTSTVGVASKACRRQTTVGNSQKICTSRQPEQGIFECARKKELMELPQLAGKICKKYSLDCEQHRRFRERWERADVRKCEELAVIEEVQLQGAQDTFFGGSGLNLQKQLSWAHSNRLQ